MSDFGGAFFLNHGRVFVDLILRGSSVLGGLTDF